MPEDQIPTPQVNAPVPPSPQQSAPVPPNVQQVYSTQPYAQPTYAQPAYQQPAQQPMTLGGWVITLIITAIPLVGLIMLFVWGFSGNTDHSKKLWAQANLIMVAIAVVLNILFLIAFWGVIVAMMSTPSYYY